MNTLTLILITFGVCLASTSEANKRTITFIAQELEPYYFKAGSLGAQGAYYEISQELCKLQKIHCKFKIANFRIALEEIQNGKADFGGPLVLTKPRESIYYYSTALFSSAYCFYSTPKYFKKDIQYTDIKGANICVFGPSATELSLFRIKEALNNELNILVEPNTHNCFRKVENNTYPYVYANCDSGKYWQVHTKSTLQEMPQLGEKILYHLVFSKKSFTEKEIESFNANLEVLRKSGTLEKIAKKFKLILAPSHK